MSERFPYLLDAEALTGPDNGPAITGGVAVADTLNSRAAVIASYPITEVPMAVIIHGQRGPTANGRKRDSDEIRAGRILETAANIGAQKYGGSLAVATTVESDFAPPDTLSQLEAMGVRIIRQNLGTSHPEAIQAAAQAISTQEGATVAMEAGNRFATTQALRTASEYVARGALGVFGPLVMDRNPSKLARIILSGAQDYYKQEADPDGHPTPDENGYMPDGAAAFSSARLLANPLDVSFADGGSFRAWAANLQRRPGDVWYDPGMALHDARASSLSKWDLVREAFRIGADT